MRNSIMNNSRSGMQDQSAKYKSIIRKYLKQIEELREELKELKNAHSREDFESSQIQ